MIVQGSKTMLRFVLMGTSLATLAACVGGQAFDGDFRRYGKGGFSTADAALNVTTNRPQPDGRGIISYPGYQVAVARQGDTVESIAARVGLSSAELASYNALPGGTTLRQGEVLALPRRVAEGAAGAPLAGTGTALPPTSGSSGIDVTTIASGAIDRAEAGNPATAKPAPLVSAPVATKPASGAQPARHKVERGETAYSIARLYNVNVRALADWNGLGNDLSVREGQILLIPVSTGKMTQPDPVDTVTQPGEGSPTPLPPSSKEALPAEKPAKASDPVKTPPAPNLGATVSAKLSMPVQGKIIRGYQKKKNDGIDISAAAGTTVAAAGDGTVAAITKDTDQVPILVVRHAGNLLTVYANIEGIAVKKGDKVKRGQALAKVRGSNPPFVHFEVRQGFDSVDPMPYLQ
jgi:murein DD-endopeptidase MepM/ murein hydrolase activator NlpD